MRQRTLERGLLLGAARQAIAHGLTQGVPLNTQAGVYPPPLLACRASFVTLKLAGELRGCIGTLEARLPLIEDVALRAHAAAFEDPRFPALEPAEFDAISIHVSVLGPAEAIPFASEAEALAALRPGIDGVILEAHGRRGTFLPAVWDALPEPQVFLRRLRLKLGLPAHYWSETMRLWRYTVDEIE